MQAPYQDPAQERPPNTANRPSNIYAVAAELPHGILVKIGYAKDTAARYSTIRGSSPVPVTLVCVRAVKDGAEAERRLHTFFAERRQHGEWFLFKAGESRILFDAFDRVAARVPARKFLRAA